ncbi:MAG: phosphatidylserine/phosphatidylglycerophosphate/cardiolipin synthase family protein [Magnetovibrio sp.]|nr:phosphatidylserine/phosphatidylglycerophosphate/cardiolipin synthase family protein [Magnetovibrio sp.]
MQSTQNNNAVDFLLDGDEYFGRMNQSLRNLITNGTRGQNNNYVRMAFWMIANDLTLPLHGGAAATPFTDILKEVAVAGFNVQIIAWKGNALMGLDHDWLTQWVATTNTNNIMSVGYVPIQLYTEQYGGNYQNCSNHQKMMVISTNGAKEAYVGGLNISDAYLSAVAHDALNDWHDTGVRLRGPAVDDIEGEWVRRWNKQPGNGPAPNAAIGPVQAAILAGAGGGLTIRTCTNNFEATPAQADIRAQMLTRIRNAQNLIYMENYALTDPLLVQQLAGAVRGAYGNNPQVSIIVDDPRGQTAGLGALGSYLMYYTFLELSLPNLTSIDIIDGFMSRIRSQTRTVAVGAMANRRVTKNIANPAQAVTTNPATNYRYCFTEGGQNRSIEFGDIWGFTPNVNANVMYTLTSGSGDQAYPHSKLAIFDDDFLVEGTSNWTYRSMQYDGEITLFINDTSAAPNFVTAVRDRLFTHWNQPNNVANWDATARQNVTNIGNGTILGVDEAPRVIPLAYGDFLHPASRDAWLSGYVWLGYGGSTYF